MNTRREQSAGFPLSSTTLIFEMRRGRIPPPRTSRYANRRARARVNIRSSVRRIRRYDEYGYH